ncbi:MAG: type II secretion system GspH family protein [Planctomycetia bacterium]|nr:type II secretion system GspH family protein [Planctomycetia bacterium]
MFYASPRCHPPRRSAFTLLEMVVAIAVTGVVLTAAGSLTMSLLRLRDARVEAHHVAASIARLDRQWRVDIRSASSAKPTAGNLCRLTLADGTVIEYLADAQRLQRTARRVGTLTQRDDYHLPVGAQLEFQLPKTSGGLARIAIDYPLLESDPRARRTIQLDAPLGADMRFAIPTTKKTE